MTAIVTTITAVDAAAFIVAALLFARNRYALNQIIQRRLRA